MNRTSPCTYSHCNLIILYLIICFFYPCKIAAEEYAQDIYSPTNYHNLRLLLENITSSYPEVSLLQSYGLSTGLTPMEVVILSSEVSKRVGKPAVKLAANIEGNSSFGSRFSIEFMKYMLENYNVDEEVTDILNNLQIFVFPTLNPDGMFSNSTGNIRGIDLFTSFPNRRRTVQEFPLEITSYTNYLSQTDVSFVLSANIRTGGYLVEYPYFAALNSPTQDTDITSDDDVFQYLAHEYVKENPVIKNNSLFDGGVIRGSERLSVSGSMPDWNYAAIGCLELTLSVTHERFPSDEQIEQIWLENKNALLRFFKSAYTMGISGSVRDARNYNRIPANIRVDSRQMVRSTHAFGSFSKLLLPGQYIVHVEALGYTFSTKTVTVVQGKRTDASVLLWKDIRGPNQNVIIVYVVVGMCAACGAIIFAIEVVCYHRSKKRLIEFFQNPDESLYLYPDRTSSPIF